MKVVLGDFPFDLLDELGRDVGVAPDAELPAPHSHGGDIRDRVALHPEHASNFQRF